MIIPIIGITVLKTIPTLNNPVIPVSFSCFTRFNAGLAPTVWVKPFVKNGVPGSSSDLSVHPVKMMAINQKKLKIVSFSCF